MYVYIYFDKNRCIKMDATWTAPKYCSFLKYNDDKDG